MRVRRKGESGEEKNMGKNGFKNETIADRKEKKERRKRRKKKGKEKRKRKKKKREMNQRERINNAK